MLTVGIAQLKARLSEYIAQVREGGEVLVTDRDRPVARLVPAEDPITASEDELRAIELERAGVLRRGRSKLPAEFWEAERPRDPDAGVRGALLDERQTGR